MPYYRHLKTVDPMVDLGPEYTAYASMVEARKGLDPKTETVTFIASAGEKEVWTTRETDRYGSDYIRVPWITASRCYYTASLPETVRYHFPHLSIKTPGLVAYTKNDEHGVQDRQTAVKPGRYLEEFFKDRFTSEQIAFYIEQCKATTSDLQIARSESDIVAIYSKKDCGFSSCMQFKHSVEYDFQTATENGYRKHPVAVYGDSDLAVAYMGDIAGKITARCVIWPDKKKYTRVYGDATLQQILRGNGYTHTTSLIGARVRYIRSGSGVILPYIDGLSCASRDGDWIILDNEGDYQCDHTSGYGCDAQDDSHDDDSDYGDDDNDYTCERCNESYAYGSMTSGEANYHHCDDCLASRMLCDHCDRRGWFDTETTSAGAEWCQSCVDAALLTCEQERMIIQTGTGLCLEPCGNQWVPEIEFTADETTDRARLHVAHLCRDCAEFKQTCTHCGHLFSDLMDRCPTCDRAVRCESTRNLEFIPGESPIDGSIWWQAKDRTGGYWAWVHGASCHVPRHDLPRIRPNSSNFTPESMDAMDSYYDRVPDPRIALRQTESTF